MRGIVLTYDNDTKRGVIQDTQNNRYDFHIGEWLSEKLIIIGEEVCFEIPKEEAINIKSSERFSFFKNFFRIEKKLFKI